jgi:hypothetical protein
MRAEVVDLLYVWPVVSVLLSVALGPAIEWLQRPPGPLGSNPGGHGPGNAGFDDWPPTGDWSAHLTFSPVDSYDNREMLVSC